MNVARKISLVTETKNASKSTTDQLASYFYKIENHHELFKMGKEFLTEFKVGIKSFAFTSTGNKDSQQRTILGLCCFFDQSTNYKIAIISDNLDHGIFSELVNASEKNNYDLKNEEDEIEYYSFHHHFDFIHYSEFEKFYNGHVYTKNFENEVQKILDHYDLIFWDIPDMEKIKENPHFHFRISHLYQSMSVIVSRNQTSGKEVEAVKAFFSNYNVNLNSVLIDNASGEPNRKKKRFLGLF